jgi:hypothetical protein
VRLSALDNDKRIDKLNKCLRPGSFATTKDDYILCKYINDDPAERGGGKEAYFEKGTAKGIFFNQAEY